MNDKTIIEFAFMPRRVLSSKPLASFIFSVNFSLIQKLLK